MSEDRDISELLAFVAKAKNGRQPGKNHDKFVTGPACRAKATSLRTMADQLTDLPYKAKMLQMANSWDVKAAEYEAEGL